MLIIMSFGSSENYPNKVFIEFIEEMLREEF